MTVTKRGNPLTRKVGPLPVWAWAALVLAAWFLYASLGRNASASGQSDTAGGQDAATASDLPVSGGGGGGADDALHRQLASSSALDTESSWGWDSYGDELSYTDAAPLAAKNSALTGQPYITYNDSSQPFAYGSAPEQRPSDDPAFGRSFYEGSIIVPSSSPASNGPTPQQVAPAPVPAPISSTSTNVTPTARALVR